MELLIVSVIGLLTVAASTALAPRVRLASPLVLVVLGIGVSFLPFVPAVRVDPQWILTGVLPPLLYSASVAMPTMNFRREFTSISGLAVVLVVISSLVLGLFFAWAIPGLGIWWGIALGAIISPTDAVATSIVKQVGVSGRVTSMLSGESLLNDAWRWCSCERRSQVLLLRCPCGRSPGDSPTQLRSRSHSAGSWAGRT